MMRVVNNIAPPSNVIPEVATAERQRPGGRGTGRERPETKEAEDKVWEAAEACCEILTDPEKRSRFDPRGGVGRTGASITSNK